MIGIGPGFNPELVLCCTATDHAEGLNRFSSGLPAGDDGGDVNAIRHEVVAAPFRKRDGARCGTSVYA